MLKPIKLCGKNRKTEWHQIQKLRVTNNVNLQTVNNNRSNKKENGSKTHISDKMFDKLGNPIT